MAKPLGYYCAQSGAGGLYQTLAPYNGTVEDASFAKLREVSLAYRVGPVGGVGDWEVSVIGRTVLTVTEFRGFDPETGIAGGPRTTVTLSALAPFTFPNPRTVTVALATTF